MKLTEDKKLEIVALLEEFDRGAESGHDRWGPRAVKGRDFYRGKQWDETVKAKLTGQGKPALTINHVLPKINFLSGTQRQNRRDLKIKARRGGLTEMALIFTGLVKHALDENDGDYQISDCFDWGTKTAKGWLLVDLDDERDPLNKRIVLESVSPFEVEEDPNGKEYDLNISHKFVTIKKWTDRSYLEAKYPEKKELMINQTISSEKGLVGKMIGSLVNFLVGTVPGDDPNVDEEVGDDESRNKNRYYRKRTWWKKYKNKSYFVDRRNLEVKVYDPDKKDEAALIKKLKMIAAMYPEKFVLKEKVPTPVLYYGDRVGSELLDYKEDPYNGCHMFPLIRFCPYWDDGYAMGVVDNLVSPQEMENKRLSNTLHILNLTGNSGQIVEKLDEGYEDVIKEFGSTPGVTIEKSKCGGFYERLTAEPISKGHMQMAGVGVEAMKDISGIADASTGAEARKKESGKLNELRQRQGLVVNEKLFDNLDYSLKILNGTMLEMIRNNEVYSKEEIVEIIEKEDLIGPEQKQQATQEVAQQYPPPPPPDENLLMKVAPEAQQMVIGKYQQALAQYQKQVEPMVNERAIEIMMEMIKKWKIGKYGIILAQGEKTLTARMERLLEMEMIHTMYPGIIPPKTLVKTTDLSAEIKEEIIENLPTAGAPTPTAAA